MRVQVQARRCTARPFLLGILANRYSPPQITFVFPGKAENYFNLQRLSCPTNSSKKIPRKDTQYESRRNASACGLRFSRTRPAECCRWVPSMSTYTSRDARVNSKKMGSTFTDRLQGEEASLKRDGVTEFDTDLCFIKREEAKRGIIGVGINNCDY